MCALYEEVHSGLVAFLARYGKTLPKTVLTPLKWDVCFIPESRHRLAALPIAMSSSAPVERSSPASTSPPRSIALTTRLSDGCNGRERQLACGNRRISISHELGCGRRSTRLPCPLLRAQRTKVRYRAMSENPHNNGSRRPIRSPRRSEPRAPHVCTFPARPSGRA